MFLMILNHNRINIIKKLKSLNRELMYLIYEQQKGR